MEWPPETPPKKKIRSNNMQLQMLVDYMAKHKRFAHGPDGYRGPFEMKKYIQQWDYLRVTLSKYGSQKSVEQWKHTWRDLKKKARDEARRFKHKTTGKHSYQPDISEMSSKILSIIENDSPEHLSSAEIDEPNLLQERSADDSMFETVRVSSKEESVYITQVEHNYDNRLHEEKCLEPEVQKENTETLNETAINIRIAVIPEGFPDIQFETDGWAVFVPIMFERLEESSELPEVDVEGIVAGAIYISCKKTSDVDWLRNTFNGEIIDGRKVKIVYAKDLPKPVKMTWQSRNYVITDNIRVLRLMQRAHPILRTTEWKVMETKVEKGLARRIVLMDRISADYIKSWGCKLSNGMCTDDFTVVEESDASLNYETNTFSMTNDNSEIEKQSNSNQQSPHRESSFKREAETPSPIQIWLEPQES